MSSADGFVADVGHALIKAGVAPVAGGARASQKKAVATAPMAVPSGVLTADHRLDVDALGERLSALWVGGRGAPATLAALLPHTVSPPQLETFAQAAFESWRVKRLLVATPAVMSCVAAGRTSGTVIDVGAFESRAVPVIDGTADRSGIVATPIGGDAALSLLAHAVRQGSAALPAQHPAHRLSDVAVVKAAIDLHWRNPADTNSGSGDDKARESGGDEDAPRHNGGEAFEPLGLRLPDGTALSVPIPTDVSAAAHRVLFDVRGAHAAVRAASPATHVGVGELAQLALRRAALQTPAAARDVVLMGGGTLLPGVEQRFLDAIAATRTVVPLRAASDGDGSEATLSALHPTATFLTGEEAGARNLLRPVGAAGPGGVLYHPLRDRLFGPWAGAAIALQLPSLGAVSVSADAYKEQGPRAVVRSLVG